MFTLGYSFKPWTDPKAIADGPQILNYVREAAAENGIEKHIRFRHRVKRAAWSTPDARWTVEAERITGEGATELVRFTCNFLFMCSGYYKYEAGYTPEFKGAADFAGRIVHPQRGHRLRWQARRRDRLGRDRGDAGAGARQEGGAGHHAPALADLCGVASGAGPRRQQIAPQPAGAACLSSDPLAQRDVGDVLLPAQPAQAREGEGPHSQRRADGARPGLRRRDPFHAALQSLDQRLCLVPDGDLFKAIREQRASVVTSEIDNFTRDGIRLKDGRELAADIIVTATGLVLQVVGGLEISVDGRAVDFANTLTYKGMMYADVPNMASAFGYTNASWTLKCDLTCEYVCRLINYMDRHNFRQCMPHNDDPTITAQPSLDFTSGYVQRSVAKMPKQGSKQPWRLYQNYALDIVSLRFGRIDDGVMQYS
ncbi:monooxygenase [Bradyrhizobium diazoefficiens]